MIKANNYNNTESLDSNNITECFESFINNNEEDIMDALSPKNYHSYYDTLNEIKASQNGSIISFGTEGFRTLLLYKNKNAIYMFSVFLSEKICSYSLVCNNESNCNSTEQNDTICISTEQDDIICETAKEFELFIKNNDISDEEPLSPKFNGPFKRMYEEITVADPYSYRIIGNEGYRTLLLYKNKNAIYFFNLYLDTIESYYVLQQIQ